MKQVLTQNDFYRISAKTIDSNPKGVVNIMRQNGLLIPENSSKKDIDRAFSALILHSKPFRKDFTDLAAKTLSKNDLNYVNAPGPDEQGTGTGDKDNAVSGSSLSGNKTANEGNYWNKVFTPELVGKLIDTSFNVGGTLLVNKSNAKNASNNIQTSLDQARYDGTDNGSAGTNKAKGMSTTGIVLISAGGLLLVGGIVYLILRKKK